MTPYLLESDPAGESPTKGEPPQGLLRLRLDRSATIGGVSTLLLSALLAVAVPASPAPGPPSNTAAVVELSGEALTVAYEGQNVLTASVGGAAGVGLTRLVHEDGGRLEQVILLEARGKGDAVVSLRGEIVASDESFPCEVDRRRAGPDVVRHSSGLSRSRLNRAVYDRARDWVLSVDIPATVRIVPLEDAPRHRFEIAAQGSGSSCAFDRATTRSTAGSPSSSPGPTALDESVAGWISWFAFKDAITEEKTRKTADRLAEALRPFGFEYVQIDDGYQQSQGAPEKWLVPQRQVPQRPRSPGRVHQGQGPDARDMDARRDEGRGLGGRPSRAVRRGRRAGPPSGNWVGCVMDASNPATLDNLVSPLYRRLKSRAGTTSSWTPCGTSATRDTTPTRTTSSGRGSTGRRSSARGGGHPRGDRARPLPPGLLGHGPSSSAWSTGAGWATTASATPASPSTTPSTTWSGGTIPTTSSSATKRAIARPP